MKLPFRTVSDQGCTKNFEKLERTVDSEPVTSLPTTDLYVGRRIVYVADSANGVHWDLVLTDPNATYPWKYLGGPPLRHTVDANETRANTAYGDLATVGPSLTLPTLAGDFDVHIGCRTIADAAAAFEGWMSYSINGGAASDANACSSVSSGQYDGGSIHMRRRLTGLTASSAFVCKYRTQVASLYHWANRYIEITPIRVG